MKLDRKTKDIAWWKDLAINDPGNWEQELIKIVEILQSEQDQRTAISVLSETQLIKRIKELRNKFESVGEKGAGELFGVPIAVKDNIDVQGLPTTAACPDFSYKPKESAFAVKQLEDSDAIIIAKTNLDQFATDLFEVIWKVQEAKRYAQDLMEDGKILITPTVPRPITLAEIEKEPIEFNNLLGYYTNYMNLLDLSGLALPWGKYEGIGLSWGVTLIGLAGMDDQLLLTAAYYLNLEMGLYLNPKDILTLLSAAPTRKASLSIIS